MSASSEAKADLPPPAQNDAEDYLKMDALVKEMAAQVHPLSLSEYQDMQKRFLETVVSVYHQTGVWTTDGS